MGLWEKLKGAIGVFLLLLGLLGIASDPLDVTNWLIGLVMLAGGAYIFPPTRRHLVRRYPKQRVQKSFLSNLYTSTMGLWDKLNNSFNELSRTSEYDDEYSRQFTKEAQHEIEPGELRQKFGSNVPLDYLDDDERLQYFLSGFDLDIDGDDEGFQTGFLVTDKKLVFLAASATGKSSQYTVTYSDIIGVSTQQRFTTQIQVETAGHSYKISVAGNKPELGKSAASYIQQRKEEVDKNSESQNETSPLDEIDKLDELRQKGAISEDEYEEKKQELLDEI